MVKLGLAQKVLRSLKSGLVRKQVNFGKTFVVGLAVGGMMFSSVAFAEGDSILVNPYDSGKLGTMAGNTVIVGVTAITASHDGKSNATWTSLDYTKCVVFGASANEGEVSGNNVKIENSGANVITMQQAIGGHSYSGKVSNNTVEVSGKVKLTHGGFSPNDGLMGGVAIGGDATGNKVVVGQGADINEICGGLSDTYNTTKGNATRNQVTVNGGTVTDEINGGVTCIAEQEDLPAGFKITQALISGDATYNIVSVENSTLCSKDDEGGDDNFGLYGGAAWCDDEDSEYANKHKTGNANYNEVTVKSTKVDRIDMFVGGESYLGAANNNKIVLENLWTTGELRDVDTQSVYGGWAGAGTANNNEVEISYTASSGETILKQVLGGYSIGGSASGNSVKVSGKVKLIHVLAGGYSDKGEIVSDNTIVLKNLKTTGTSTGDEQSIYGGWAEKGKASRNKVEISGIGSDGTLLAGVYGGCGGKEATGNIVEIKDSVISSDIVAGGVVDVSNGSVKDNKVIVDDVTFNFAGTNRLDTTGTAIVGGGFVGEGNFTGTRSGNNLTVGSKGFNVNGGKEVTIQNFDSFTAADGATVTNNGTLNFKDNKGDIVWNTKIVGSGTLNISNNNITVSNDVTQGKINVDGVNLTMADGKSLTVNTLLTMTGTNSSVTLDKAIVLDANLAVLNDFKGKIAGEAGELNLRFAGAEYTATQYGAVKTTLFASGAKTALNFVDGVLKVDETKETIGIQGEMTGAEIKMDGVVPVVVNKNSGSSIEVGSQNDKTVGIMVTGSADLQKADQVSFGGSSNVVAKDLQIKELTTAGKAFVIVVDGNSKLTLAGAETGIVKDDRNKAVATSVEVKANSIFNLGTADATSVAKAGKLDTLTISGGKVNIYHVIVNLSKLVIADGGVLWLDPAYTSVSELNFTKGGVGVDTDGTVLNVGMSETTLNSALQAAGFTMNADKTVANGKGVLALGKTASAPLDLTGGGKHLEVNSAYTGTSALKLGAGAVLAVTAKADTTAIKVDKAADVSVDKSASLVVVAEDFKAGESVYKVLTAGSGEFGNNLWTEDNIYASDPTYKLVFDTENTDKKNYVLKTDWNKVDGIFGDGAIAAANTYDAILQKGAGTEANKFLKAVVNATAGSGSTAVTKAAGAKALNAVTNMGEMAGVQHGTMTMIGLAGSALADNLSITNRPMSTPVKVKVQDTGVNGKAAKITEVGWGDVKKLQPVNSIGEDESKSKQVWAGYVYTKEDVDGAQLAGVTADYTAKYRGAVVGTDLWKAGKNLGGVAINYAKGDVSGYNGVHTTNDVDHLGVNFYNRYALNQNSAVLADVGYMKSKSDIRQSSYGTEITAEPKAEAYTLAVRYEKMYQTGRSNLTPFAQVRYAHMSTKSYCNSMNMEFDADKQNLIIPQVGVAWSGRYDIKDSDWKFQPKVEVGYIWNLGDRDTTQTVRFGGAVDSLSYDVADPGNYYAGLEMEFVRKNLAFDLGYKYSNGSSADSSRWNLDVKYLF